MMSVVEKGYEIKKQTYTCVFLVVAPLDLGSFSSFLSLTQLLFELPPVIQFTYRTLLQNMF